MTRVVKWTLCAAYVVACVLAWPDLPERIPYHFNLRGHADGWAENSWPAWFGLPAVALLLLIAMEAVGHFSMRTAPQLWNVPEKEKFLALTGEKRTRVMRQLRTFLDVTGIWCVLLIMVVQYEIYVVATRNLNERSGALGLVIVAFTVALVAYAFVFSRRVGKLIVELSRP